MTEQEQRTATVSGPVTGGRGWAFGSPADAAAFGYVIEEFLLDGVEVAVDQPYRSVVVGAPSAAACGRVGWPVHRSHRPGSSSPSPRSARS